MKLRISGNSIRLRLTQDEVERIKEQGLIEEKTEFPNGQNFVYSLSTAETISASFSDGKLEIFIPKSTAENWMDTKEIGIYGTYGGIEISVEKDLRI